MGSVGSDAHLHSEDDFVVLVTGFAPFGKWPVNPSWEIASRLPRLIPVVSKSLQSATPSTFTSSLAHRKIRILVHPSPVKVGYAAVRELVPNLWTSMPRIDYMIHIGMASGRKFYSVERRGHREGYETGDVDGIVLGDEKEKAERTGEKWIWEDCPPEILTDIDIEEVWRRWRAARPNDDLRISEDAGKYLCDFIYYSSLAQLWQKKEDRRVVFLHVPVDTREETILKGRDILEELIRSVVVTGAMKSMLKQEN